MRHLTKIHFNSHRAVAAHLRQRPNDPKALRSLLENRNRIGVSLAETAERDAGIRVTNSKVEVL
jgi:hypothetical protein